jgi:hypothetical protein
MLVSISVYLEHGEITGSSHVRYGSHKSSHMASFSTKWRKRRASSGFVRGQLGEGGFTTDEIIINRRRSGGDAGRKGAIPADMGGVLLDETSDVMVGEPQVVSNSSGPLSGLEASLIVACDSSMKTTSGAAQVRLLLTRYKSRDKPGTRTSPWRLDPLLLLCKLELVCKCHGSE